MVLTPDSYNEKQSVKNIIADLAVTCLWHPEVTEASGKTREHSIKAWKDQNGRVYVEVRHK